MNKIMKKAALCTAMVCGFSLLVSSQSFGNTLSAQAGGAGTTVTIAANTGAGPDLTYNPSPNVWMQITGQPIAYAIQAMNANIANGDRNEYAIWSQNTGYYQAVNGDMADATIGVVLTDFTVTLTADYVLTGTPFGGTSWVAIGGGGT